LLPDDAPSDVRLQARRNQVWFRLFDSRSLLSPPGCPVRGVGPRPIGSPTGRRLGFPPGGIKLGQTLRRQARQRRRGMLEPGYFDKAGQQVALGLVDCPSRASSDPIAFRTNRLLIAPAEALAAPPTCGGAMATARSNACVGEVTGWPNRRHCCWRRFDTAAECGRRLSTVRGLAVQRQIDSVAAIPRLSAGCFALGRERLKLCLAARTTVTNAIAPQAITLASHAAGTKPGLGALLSKIVPAL